MTTKEINTITAEIALQYLNDHERDALNKEVIEYPDALSEAMVELADAYLLLKIHIV